MNNGNDTLIGCGVLLALVMVFVVITYWPIVLTMALLAGAAALLVSWSTRQAHQRLGGIAAAAQRRFAGSVCRCGDRYGIIDAIDLAGRPGAGHLRVRLQMLEEGDGDIRLIPHSALLPPPADLGSLASNSGIARFLASHDIAEVGDLAVEARATQAAVECLREADWAAGALRQLQELIDSTARTLAKAGGNELLEPSIPQLQEALAAFTNEAEKLSQARDEAHGMLRKLVDFLSVPEEIRPILSFDLESLFDPARLADLEQSFQDVVLLNDAFRDLSREKLA